MSLSKSDIEVLQHSLGLNYKRVPFRNYFCAGAGDFEQMERLVGIGLMKRGRVFDWCKYYHVTKAGEQLAIEELPELPKYTKGQLRYQRYLNASDCNPDLTFGEFLKDPFYKQYRETGTHEVW